MTSNAPAPTAPGGPLPGVVGVIAACAALAWGLDASGLTPTAAWPWSVAGVLGAGVLGAGGAMLKAKAAAGSVRRDDPAGARAAATRLQAAVLGDFLVHLIAVSAALFAMHRSGVKFAGLCGLGAGFAGTAFLVQIVGGLTLSRLLRASDRPTTAGGGPGAVAAPSREGPPVGGVEPVGASPDAAAASPSSAPPSRDPAASVEAVAAPTPESSRPSSSSAARSSRHP